MEQLEKLAEVIEDHTKPYIIKCPSCGSEFDISPLAQFKENVMTMEYHMEEGHMLQAETLGGTMSAAGRLMKAIAKDIGGNVEVLVKDVRVKPGCIAIDYLTVNAKPKSKRGAIAPDSGQAVSGKGPVIPRFRKRECVEEKI